ncbi:MAG: [protein-PII] uridylyltransferase [Actinomycetota bacterium]|nr:[protein-PII] uridylyltransferase [Actinomycetota bacterium]
MSAGALRELRSARLEDRTRRGPDWCREWAAVVDTWLADLLASVAPEPVGLALMAVGGYGRASLAPGSDLDLLLVHDGRRKPIKGIADALWYPIWDAGQPLDHSVRTLKELRTAMDSDIKVGLGLLDARLVAGDPELAGAVSARVRDMWKTRAAKWLTELDGAVRGRHDRFGDLASLLEPDLKEARGGLRDIQQLRTLAQIAPVLDGLTDHRALRWAERLLTDARVELQRPTGSAGNVLLLQDQDLVAKALDIDDADTLMVAVADAARSIAWASDDGWRRIRSWLAGPKGRSGGGDLVLEPGIVLRDGEVTLLGRADPAADTSLALRVAAASAERDVPIARATLDRLEQRSMAPEGVWPVAALNALLRLLGAGRPAIAAIEALDQQGVWLRYLPEWSPVRNRPQRNAYHRFTVDRHLLETVANASSLQSAVHRPDMLLLGALLHDIGKGQGGDHTDIGIEVVASLGPRLGLPPADVTTLQTLVRYHLLLPDVATRRDLDDPATATAVAGAVGDQDTLELLAALTRADSLATGPAAWGSWKAGLVDRLVDQVAATLEGRPPPDTGGAELTGSERAILAGGELSVVYEEGRLRVGAPDQSGLLSCVAGVLTLSGVYVRSATTISDQLSGMALLRFEVSPAFDELPSWDKVRADVAAALDGRMDVERLLEEREARYSRLQASTQARVPDARVIFDLESSPSSTIVEVRARDRGPVLYRVTRALSASGVSITCALVSTLGAEAVDVFYVGRPTGGRVDDPATLSQLEAAVLAAL